MLKIKDYIILKEIYNFLEIKRIDELSQNNGYSSNPIEEIEKLMIGLKKILEKLEIED